MRDENGSLLNSNNSSELQLTEEQNTQKEQEMIDGVLSRVENTMDDVLENLTFVSNIITEDLIIDGVGFRSEEIENIKNCIRIINK